MTDPAEIMAKELRLWIPGTVLRETVSKDILRALSVAGYAVVPKVATEAMRGAGVDVRIEHVYDGDDFFVSNPEVVWTAMVAAALAAAPGGKG